MHQLKKGYGLFGGIKGATIKNVNVVDSCISANKEKPGDCSRFAILVGVVDSGTCLIENCSVQGFVQAYEYNGYFVERNQSGTLTISGCTANCAGNASKECGKGDATIQ